MDTQHPLPFLLSVSSILKELPCLSCVQETEGKWRKRPTSPVGTPVPRRTPTKVWVHHVVDPVDTFRPRTSGTRVVRVCVVCVHVCVYLCSVCTHACFCVCVSVYTYTCSLCTYVWCVYVIMCMCVCEYVCAVYVVMWGRSSRRPQLRFPRSVISDTCTPSTRETLRGRDVGIEWVGPHRGR